MYKRLFNSVILLTLLIGQLPWKIGYSANSTAIFDSVDSPETASSEIQVLQTHENGLSLALDTPLYSLTQVTYDSQNYDQLTFPGGTLQSEPGQPQLPLLSGLIGVPPGAEVKLAIMPGAATLLEGVYTLPPGAHAIPSEIDFEPGQLGYEPDPATYTLDQWFPREPVQIGEETWIRDQRVARVTFFPFQYNPAQKTIRWHPHLHAEITFSGQRASGSFSISPFEDLFAQTLLNYETARSFRADDYAQVESPFQYASLGARFDITVNQNGIYRLLYADLQAAGMDVETVDPATFHLSNQGQDVSIYVFGEGDGSFDPGDYISFYGEKFRGDVLAERYQTLMDPGNGQPANNWFWLCEPTACDLAKAFEQYTDNNIYSLTVGGTPSPRMATVDGTPTGGTVPTVYTTTVRAEESNYWWAFEFGSEDVWFWSQIQRQTSTLPYTTTYSVNLENLAPGFPATIHAEVASRNSTSSFPDHHTQFRLNPGTPILDDAYWDGRTRYTWTAEVLAEDLLEGNNDLLFTMLPDVAVGNTRMYFDFFEITYTRLFVALADQLDFVRYAPGTWKYQIGNFLSPSVEVYNLDEPLAPVRVLNPTVTGSGPYTASFRTVDGEMARYYVAGANTLLTPVSILQYQPPNFATMPAADYVFITHEDFIPSLQPLAAYRAAQGLTVAIIDVDDLYREFNDGIYHPIAIRNFLAYTFENWEEPPLYVALVGNGHWNFKNYGAATEPYKNPPPVYMPPNLAVIDPWQGQTDATNLLATLVGDDALPDLHIARFPVSTPAELDILIGKTLAYETQPVADWQQNITFIADNIPDPAGAGDFIALAEGIISTYIDPDPYYEPIRIYENDFDCTATNTLECDAVTQNIIDTINITGTLLVNYIGHGSLNRWSGESIFLNSDVASLNNPNQLPIILSMTCLDGYWLFPNTDSLAKVFLTTEGKGAVAAYSPTGLGVATGHDELQRGFFDALFLDGKWELGASALQAKMRLFSTLSNYDLLHTFTIFGDPAIHFSTPYEVNLTPSTDAQAAPIGETVTYTLTLSNPGLVTDTFSVVLSDNSWNAAIATPVLGPLGPGASAAFTVTVDIPPSALGNQTDQLTVKAISQHAIHQTASSTLWTSALTEGLLLTPFTQTGSGAPGTSFTYTFSLTNTSFLADVFTLTLTGNVWATNLSAASLPLGPGDSADFQVVVQIPETALGHDIDQVSVSAQSSNTPANAALATAQTTAQTGGFALSPTQTSLQGYPGETVFYNLQIQNLLNTAEFYIVALSGQVWPSAAAVTVGPANPGEVVNFLVSVTLPESVTEGMSDTVGVTVSMLDDPTVQASSVLTTVALAPPPSDGYWMYLPVIVRP